MARLTGDFRKFMDKNYLGSWDIPDGDDLILTIDHAEQSDVKNERGSERKLVLHFVEREFKPMILNTTNATAIGKAYGSNKVEDWEGKKVSIYTTKVPAFGSVTDALRIREYPPRVEEAFCADCGEEITAHGKYTVNKIVKLTEGKYGRRLCWECAQAAKEVAEAEEANNEE